MKKSEKGITIISLVITIIVLLIIAGVTLKELSDEGLIFKVKDETAAQQEQIATEQEKMDNVKESQLEDWGF